MQKAQSAPGLLRSRLLPKEEESFPGRRGRQEGGRDGERSVLSCEDPDFGPGHVCITLHLCFLLPKGPQSAVSMVHGQPDSLCVGGGVGTGAAPLALTKEKRLESQNSAQAL